MRGVPPLLLLSIAVVPACASQMEQAVRRRASFDLGCQPEQLQVQGLGGRSYGVTGCGRRASYVLQGACSTEGTCTAVLDSPSDVAGAGAPQAPGARMDCKDHLTASNAYKDWHQGPTLAFNGLITIKQTYQCPRGTCFMAEMTFERWTPETNLAAGFWSGPHLEFRRYVDSLGYTQYWRGECSVGSVKGTWSLEINPADHGVFEIFY